MEFVYKKVKHLIPYINNARTHDQKQIDQIIASIKEFGFTNPVLIDETDNIIAGHGRLLAAKKMGLDEIPCIIIPGLNEAQKKAYIIADNKIALNSGWDEDLLRQEFESLKDIDFDLDIVGFNLSEIHEIMNITDEPTEDNYDLDTALDEIIEPKSKPGDIYQLGNHRVMCGSCTVPADMSTLMNEKFADLVVTDPPYNMNYQGAGNTINRKEKKILNDHLSNNDFDNLLISSFENMREVMKEGATAYVFYKELGHGTFLTNAEKANLTFKQELIWVKNQIVVGGSKYQNMYEPCLMLCKEKISIWNGGRKQKSVIEDINFMNEDELREAIKNFETESLDTDIIRVNKNLVNDLHPTMKPIRLLSQFIKNSSNPGDIVLDTFGGSGSTLIACEQLNRTCYMMELDPKYVDVIIDRWERFTGKQAIKLTPVNLSLLDSLSNSYISKQL